VNPLKNNKQQTEAFFLQRSLHKNSFFSVCRCRDLAPFIALRHAPLHSTRTMSENRLAIFPTRMALQGLKQKLTAATKGHDLLKKKADALTMRFRQILKKIKDVRTMPHAPTLFLRHRREKTNNQTHACCVPRDTSSVHIRLKHAWSCLGMGLGVVKERNNFFRWRDRCSLWPPLGCFNNKSSSSLPPSNPMHKYIYNPFSSR
jgi:hypothetical protein